MDYKQEKFSSQFIFKNPNETELVVVVSPLKFNHYNTSQIQLDEECVRSYKSLEISIQCKHQFDHQ